MKKEAHGKGRDLFISKKGFSALPQFDGKTEKYDDWRFKVVTFLEMEDQFSEFLTFIESLPKMPTEEECIEWEMKEADRNFKRMNEQLYNFLCLNLKDEALNIVKKYEVEASCQWSGELVEVPARLSSTDRSEDSGIG